MSVYVEAVFEKGVFRPLQPVRWPEHQRVTVAIDWDSADRPQFVLSDSHWQDFCDALDAPPKDIPALRKLLTEPSVFDVNDSTAS